MDLVGVLVDTAAVLLGSFVGILFSGKINEKYIKTLMAGLALVTAVMGVMNATETQDILCVIICMVLGTVLGEVLKIDDRIERLGDAVKRKLLRGKVETGRFTEGFLTASILFCVGSMIVMGSLEAGINGDNSIFFTKSILDFTASIAFAASMGIGVMASAACVLVVEGGLTLLAGLLEPLLAGSTVTEMTAIGGVLLLGMAVNLLELRAERLKIANMLPAMFLPMAYFPICNWLAGVIG